jgi:GNAT superfamily N-acetyltransferase
LYSGVTTDEQRALRDAYDAALRVDETPLPAEITHDRDGPLHRLSGFSHGGVVLYRDLGGLEGAGLDALIARQVAFFRERGEPFEWKSYAHDAPGDLGGRLGAAGLLPEDAETIEIAPVAAIAADAALPDGVELVEVRDRAGLDRISQMESEIWGDSRGWLADDLEAELAVVGDALRVFAVEAVGETVSAGWIRFPPGTPFATLWGGGTLPAWRGKGIYRALVAHRARLAEARGVRYLQVDASDDSRPILERLGFVAVTTSTPYTWQPS